MAQTSERLNEEKRDEKVSDWSRTGSQIVTWHVEICTEILDSDFCLYGFVYSESELSQEVYFWHGDADAMSTSLLIGKLSAIYWISGSPRTHLEYTYTRACTQSCSSCIWSSTIYHQSYLFPSPATTAVMSDLVFFFYYPDECKELINNQLW